MKSKNMAGGRHPSWTRRRWLSTTSAALTSSAMASGLGTAHERDAAGGQPAGSGTPQLPLAQFEPRSMLHVAETQVARAAAVPPDRY